MCVFFGLVTAVFAGAVGEGELVEFQAAMTMTVTTAIAASEIRTTFVSMRRLRRCGRAAERRARDSPSSPPPNRELYSST